MKHIFVLIRPKKKQTPMERFEKEVLSSQCFGPLITELGEAEWKRRVSKIVPVAGDILMDGLGLSAEDTSRIAANCNVIIHLAATVDFMEKLNMSVKMNVLGTLRVMALARKCANIEAVIHTSTCYVNWNRHGLTPVMETQYAIPFDPEAMCKYILSLDDSIVADEQARLMKKYNFPNTYTFTKRMTEHILQQYRAELPLTIVRPAIIGSSWKEPCPGWVDALTAAGGIFLTSGLGILKELQAQPDYVADLVPVDFVVNTLLKASFKTMVCQKKVALGKSLAPSAPLNGANPAPRAAALVTDAKVAGTAGAAAAVVGGGNATSANAFASASPATAAAPPESVASDSASTMPFVFQSCTSNSLNPLTWGLCCKTVLDYWTKHPHEKAIGKCQIYLTPSKPEYMYRWYMYRRLPFEALKLASKLPPPIGGPDKQKLVTRYARALFRAQDLNFQFQPFTMYQWFYDASNMKFLDEGMTTNNFATDTCDINWYSYLQMYQFGMIKFIMRSQGFQPPMPQSGSEQFLKASL